MTLKILDIKNPIGYFAFNVASNGQTVTSNKSKYI